MNAIIAAPRADDLSRYEQEVLPLRGYLYACALRLTHNRWDAEDIVQDTLLKAYQYFHSFRPGTNVNAWLYRVLMNTFFSFCRRKQKELRHSVSHEPADWQLTRAQAYSVRGLRSAETEALERVPGSDLITAMRALPADLRTVAYLADVEGFTYRQIADMMGTPIGTVMSRLHRARHKLRLRLSESRAEAC
jgi:RNA polymerase sigma-70 factor, ECF subfamily